MPIIYPQEVQAMTLPIDLSGYTANQLTNIITQAEEWCDGEARASFGFSMKRVVDRIYGTGTNKLAANHFPILTLNSIQIIFPPNTGANVNLPGPNMVPIDPSRVVIDRGAGLFYNWSPFVFQTIGYMTVFPEGVPINVDYFGGYINTLTTGGSSAGSNIIPVQSASCFYFGQKAEFYEDTWRESLTVQGTTSFGGFQYVVTLDPMNFSHTSGVSFGDMPKPVKLAAAFMACDFALRALNPENLVTIEIDKVRKDYQRALPVHGKTTNVGGPLYENERPFVEEARRLLNHFSRNRGIW